MTISVDKRFSILERDGFTCQFCGKRAPETELEVDHLHPRSEGGEDDDENLVTACRDCNRGKGKRIVSLDRAEWNTLVGKFFHELRENERVAQRQGQILGWVKAAQSFTVRYYDWVMGSDDWAVHLVPVQSVCSGRWLFYETDEDMRHGYEYSGLAAATTMANRRDGAVKPERVEEILEGKP